MYCPQCNKELTQSNLKAWNYIYGNFLAECICKCGQYIKLFEDDEDFLKDLVTIGNVSLVDYEE